nr:hypothetical protein [Ralstonia solanacearum]
MIGSSALPPPSLSEAVATPEPGTARLPAEHTWTGGVSWHVPSDCLMYPAAH